MSAQNELPINIIIDLMSNFIAEDFQTNCEGGKKRKEKAHRKLSMYVIVMYTLFI